MDSRTQASGNQKSSSSPKEKVLISYENPIVNLFIFNPIKNVNLISWFFNKNNYLI